MNFTFKKYMNSKIKILLSCCFLASLYGCTSGYCRMNKKSDKNLEASPTATPNPPANITVKVFKYDGSQQCSMGKQISIEEMKKDLKDIKVITQAHLNDGLMRIQLCGSPTGYANVYEISKADLEKALALGFREWTFD